MTRSRLIRSSFTLLLLLAMAITVMADHSAATTASRSLDPAAERASVGSGPSPTCDVVGGVAVGFGAAALTPCSLWCAGAGAVLAVGYYIWC